MTVPIRLRPEVEGELAETAAWYQEQWCGLGLRFLDEVEAGLEVISEMPLLFAVVHRNIRRAPLRRFPFGIFYHVDDEGIVVVAVMHDRRDPRNWQART